MYVLCVSMCVYYSNYIVIMSNICARTDTCTCSYYFLGVNISIRLYIVYVVVQMDACICILQEFYIISHTESSSVAIICI